MWDAENTLPRGCVVSLGCPCGTASTGAVLLLATDRSWLSAHPVPQPGPALPVPPRKMLGVPSTLRRLAPHQMKARGLAGPGGSRGSEGLPASWPGPPICHDAFIRATESPLGSVAVLGEQGWPQERGVRPLFPPCQVSWQPCP